MGNALQDRIKNWKKSLLDFGKRNRLINFKDTKRSSLKITIDYDNALFESSESHKELFNLIVGQEKTLKFPFAKDIQIDEEGEEIYPEIVKGDVKTNSTLGESQKTLKALRYKARTSIEEQGLNTLFLAFGFLDWNESEISKQRLKSPLILVPIHLTIESLTSPYMMSLGDDEIVINPTLSHKLHNDFGIEIPTFDYLHEDIEEYLSRLEKIVKLKNWHIIRDTNLTTLSFLKINMYNDLERNEEKLENNLLINALVGNSAPINIPKEFNNYDHDAKVKPKDVFQVVDADSSQQDAILLSKSNVSFVLQGPPGTGKSQTITNIIAEAIADGRKVLFVSEKMAALQVVYKRLENVGLADFCLTLHSHKANKKDILSELDKSVNLDRKKVRDEIIDKLNLLEFKRQELNKYQEELHVEHSSLNYSIYKVNGLLAKLESTPEVIIKISNVENVTREQLSNICYTLDEYSKTTSRRSEDYSKNTWRNTTVETMTHEFRHEIDSKVTAILPQLEAIKNLIDKCTNEMGNSHIPSINYMKSLIKTLTILAKSPIIPARWINDDINKLIKDAKTYKRVREEIDKAYNSLKSVYEQQLFDLNGEEKNKQLMELTNKVASKLQLSKVEGNVINELKQTLESVGIISEKLIELNTKTTSVTQDLGLELPRTFEDMQFIAKLSQLLLLDISPTELWFDKERFNNIDSVLQKAQTSHNEILELKRDILKTFDQDLFDVDFYPMLQRFRSSYNSIFRVLKGSYRKDIKKLNQYKSDGVKLNYDGALQILGKLKDISDKTKLIENDLDMYRSYFGQKYTSLNTDWQTITESLKRFSSLINLFKLHHIPDGLKKNLLSQTIPKDKLVDLDHVYISNFSDDIISKLNEYLILKYNHETEYSTIHEELSTVLKEGELLLECCHSILDVRKEVGTLSEIMSEILQLCKFQENEKFLENKCESNCHRYADYYQKEDTKWQEIIDALEFSKELKELMLTQNLPKHFINKVCEEHKTISFCKSKLDELTKLDKDLEANIQWALNLFEKTEDLENYHITDLSDRLAHCKDNKKLLEEWIDYQTNKRKCKDLGLLPYINEVEEKELDTHHIENAYLKQFYRLWLDAVLPNSPNVQAFRGRVHERNIKEFQDLDKMQFPIAQSRVRERAFEKIPDFNTITSTKDEIGILKRELHKKRGIMPLRRLFKSIPTLLTSLKPCFMMSPLSVSVFLEAQSYNFDLIVFDEASQVHTEDAIGAIMRGQQVIIVGDTKQLPPTNFFVSSLEDDDFDTDQDETSEQEDVGGYESILDESVTVLPERSLRWHYRSRHEHLIAFSNIKIYKNSLITFPSSINKASDLGVEYIYVSDGIYDRSAKRNNVKEAQKVANLVFEHCKQTPNRTLGVVTFSEAQQQAIDAAIRQRRLQDRTYEHFFAEDNEEPFFIKNLENVQGDERDTIIFSIGYAKDATGKMYMNFGPLSKEGGHRRLNVAITRAKYNIKLVGSIVPTDIDLERTSAEGVRLLRSYIEFAQQGIIALQNELSYNEQSLDFDSPFEEAVYDFLIENEFQVVTQVGCSGFRIDMAVKHPKLSGIFVIGIECDGATYHSARTARERDRLRQMVLEDMGWTIHRIWSTDWIKDQKTEGEKLIAAIKRALIKMDTPKIPFVADSLNTTIGTLMIEDIEEDVEVSDTTNTYGFIPYERIDSDNIENLSPQIAIKEVIRMEQPIHFQELCKRVAPLYGNEKVTSKIRNEVENVFKYYLREEIELVGEFISLKNFELTQVRMHNTDDDYIRQIEHISNEELSLALKIIVDKSYGITPDSLFDATRAELGYKRMGENIRISIHSVYSELINNEELKEVDGKVQIC